ncbi:MAG: Preflagellin peptidase [Methanomassiliicoccales archaeon PtaU1.Bin030]|nr:MAG: Preflagellin peptidase [Methanomassiliicoccales archaeon PtaU1.Bin030]
MDWISVLKVAIAFIVLAIAARADWRTREASDVYWMVIGGTGMFFLAAQIVLDGANIIYLAMLAPIAWFFVDIFWDRKGMFEDGISPLPLGLYAISFGILAMMIYLYNADIYFWKLMIVPIMFLIFILLYQFDIIKGGADAKALIALSIMFPLYPIIEPFPLIDLPYDAAQFVLPFPLLILFNAAIITVIVPVLLLFYNLSKKQVRFPAMILGYRMPIEEAKGKFVWPMERVEEGAVKFSVFPPASETLNEDLDRLSAAGLKEVWVTPKIPFLIPIAASLLFSVIVGNLLFLFIR